MLWLKAFHVIAVVAWFAGLFYLPRLFIYHTEATEPLVRERLKVMERRLYGITRIGAGLTFIFGVATLWWWIAHTDKFFAQNHWIEAKFMLVALLYGYHGYLGRLVREFAHDACTKSSRWLRIFNEIPALLLIAIVVLVIVKPF